MKTWSQLDKTIKRLKKNPSARIPKWLQNRTCIQQTSWQKRMLRHVDSVSDMQFVLRVLFGAGASKYTVIQISKNLDGTKDVILEIN